MIDRRLLDLASDPDRVRALTLLNEQTAGAGEVAGVLGVGPAEAGRILEGMREDGLIEVVGEALNRGAMEPRYRALMRVFWDDEDWAVLGLDEQQRMSAWIVEMLSLDMREALESGTLLARPESHVSRTVPRLDERGWEEVLRIHRDALDAILAVEAASAERLAEAGEAGIPVLSATFCCEMPARGSGKREAR